MCRALSRDEVRAFDQYAIQQVGIPAAVLMENAGRGAAEVIRSLGKGGRVAICCGKGNNGGDGMVMARHLENWGVDVFVLLLARVEELSPDSALEWNILQKMGVPAQMCAPESLSAAIAEADWIVDALFGTGLTGPVRPPFDGIIRTMNATGKPVLALDIPSGLDCDTGLPMGDTIRAEHTVTFVAPKIGFQHPGSANFTGKIHVADIGITPRQVRSA